MSRLSARLRNWFQKTVLIKVCINTIIVVSLTRARRGGHALRMNKNYGKYEGRQMVDDIALFNTVLGKEMERDM